LSRHSLTASVPSALVGRTLNARTTGSVKTARTLELACLDASLADKLRDGLDI
jgi:hypothetical protein